MCFLGHITSQLGAGSSEEAEPVPTQRTQPHTVTFTQQLSS